MKKQFSICVLATLISLTSFATQAQVTVKDAWVRATVAPQKVTGAFMRISSQQEAKLVAISSPLTNHIEIHSMEMEGDMMKMREVKELPLPAGTAVELKPGGLHVMLFDLKNALKAGEKVTLKLTVEDKNKQRQQVEVQALVKAMNGGM